MKSTGSTQADSYFWAVKLPVQRKVLAFLDPGFLDSADSYSVDRPSVRRSVRGFGTFGRPSSRRSFERPSMTARHSSSKGASLARYQNENFEDRRGEGLHLNSKFELLASKILNLSCRRVRVAARAPECLLFVLQARPFRRRTITLRVAHSSRIRVRNSERAVPREGTLKEQCPVC